MATKVSSQVIQGLPVGLQADTTNSTLTNARMEIGWGVMSVATSQSFVQEQVTFSTAFTSRPIVVITMGGDSTTNGGYGGGGNSIEGVVISKAHTITTSTFWAYIGKPGGTNYGANGFIWYQWIAIGV